jgi:hypothetical protein
MKKVLLAVLVAAFVMVGTNAYAVTMADWWAYGNVGNIVESVGNIEPGADIPNFDVEYLGLHRTDDALYFALQTKWDLVSVPSDPVYPYIYNGDFVFDTNGDGSFDSALDFLISGSDVTFNLYQTPNLVWENGTIFSDLDPIGVKAGQSTLVTSYAIQNAFAVIDGSFTIAGALTAAQAGYNMFSEDLSYSMQWAMSCGNDGDLVKVVPVPEPATMALLGLSTLGLAAFRRKK